MDAWLMKLDASGNKRDMSNPLHAHGYRSGSYRETVMEKN